MKKIKLTVMMLSLLYSQLQATVKTFVNNSPKKICIRVYDSHNKIIELNLSAGDIQDVFIPDTTINKIVIMQRNDKRRAMSGMARNELRATNSAINDNMVFIINKNSSINMYKGTTNRQAMLLHLDQAYIEKKQLPTINLSIHTIKSDQLWTCQEITYDLKYKK